MDIKAVQELSGYVERLEDANAALRAEVVTLRAALGPLAACAADLPIGMEDDHLAWGKDVPLTAGDVRRAAAVLGEPPGAG